MRYYESGNWGLSLVWGIRGSVFPRSCAVAVPNAILTFIFASLLTDEDRDSDTTNNALTLLTGFTSVLFFVLYFRSNIAYDRWWEGGTLLQKTRGEWFNAYSSLMAFTSTLPEMENKVEEFHHLMARMFSLLFACALQQVSPCKDRPFEVIDLSGIDELSLVFLNDASDKVEVILQWIQRATVVHMHTGVLPIAPPVLSRAFQEISRGIVNLQNARKIADFPFPFPYAQASMVMLIAHFFFVPVAASMLFKKFLFHRVMASAVSFFVIFFTWCINFIALQLETPFGDRVNDLPMDLMQRDWNKSLGVLLAKRAQRPPDFIFVGAEHRLLALAMSDGSNPKMSRLSVPVTGSARLSTTSARKWTMYDDAASKKARKSTISTRNSTRSASPQSTRNSSNVNRPQKHNLEKTTSIRSSGGSTRENSYGPENSRDTFAENGIEVSGAPGKTRSQKQRQSMESTNSIKSNASGISFDGPASEAREVHSIFVSKLEPIRSTRGSNDGPDSSSRLPTSGPEQALQELVYRLDEAPTFLVNVAAAATGALPEARDDTGTLRISKRGESDTSRYTPTQARLPRRDDGPVDGQEMSRGVDGTGSPRRDDGPIAGQEVFRGAGGTGSQERRDGNGEDLIAARTLRKLVQVNSNASLETESTGGAPVKAKRRAT